MKKIGFLFLTCGLVHCQSINSQNLQTFSPQEIPAILQGENGSSTSLPAPHPPPPMQWKVQTPTQITFVGANSSASFSNDGQRILYLSRQRAPHSLAQIYEYSLVQKKERRITHQDGWIGWARYLPNSNRMVYSSTTDEIKEDLDRLMKETFSPHPPASEIIPGVPYAEEIADLPFEIYISELDGSQIHRITDSVGFDSLATPHPNKKAIIFSSFRVGDGELYEWSLTHKTTSRLTHLPGPDIQAEVSPNGQSLVWVHQDKPNSPTTQLLLGNAKAQLGRPLLKKPATYLNPTWHPDNKTILFSSNFEDGKNFELYTFNIETSCLNKLTENEAIDKEPSFSPDGKKIIFTSNRTGTDQIFLMDYVASENCWTVE